jgi:hypothetical protein
VVVTTAVVVVVGIGEGDGVVFHLHRRLGSLPASIRRRSHAETETDQYRQQNKGTQQNCRVIWLDGLWLCACKRHDVAIPDLLEKQQKV